MDCKMTPTSPNAARKWALFGPHDIFLSFFLNYCQHLKIKLHIKIQIFCSSGKVQTFGNPRLSFPPGNQQPELSSHCLAHPRPPLFLAHPREHWRLHPLTWSCALMMHMGNWGYRGAKIPPRVTWQVNGRAGIRTQVTRVPVLPEHQ